MKYRHLLFNGVKITNPRKIEEILNNNKFYWVIDAEFENAEIEIKNDTIIWMDGIWLYGVWEYGIWLSGEFRLGVWKNGIFEGGDFINGSWESGIFSGGVINDSVNILKIKKIN